MAAKQDDRLISQLVENQLGVISYWLFVRGIVIPAKAGIQCCYNPLHYWMPDQVRHDGQKLSVI